MAGELLDTGLMDLLIPPCIAGIFSILLILLGVMATFLQPPKDALLWCTGAERQCCTSPHAAWNDKTTNGTKTRSWTGSGAVSSHYLHCGLWSLHYTLKEVKRILLSKVLPNERKNGISEVSSVKDRSVPFYLCPALYVSVKWNKK